MSRPILLALLLSGCASPNLICDMRINYERTVPIATEGRASFSWKFEQILPERVYGDTRCARYDDGRECLILLTGTPPKFSDICGLARLGHEVAHYMGAKHER